jgi:ankyrin repeat protein
MPFSKNKQSAWGLAQRGDAAALQALLCGPRRVMIGRSERTWALKVAARNDHVAAVAVLLKHGATVEDLEQETLRETMEPDVYVFGLLQCAAMRGSGHAAAVLLNARASVDNASWNGWVSGSMCSLAAKMGYVHMVALAAAAGAMLGGYPIHAATSHGQTQVIECLLSLKVCVNQPNADKDTCLEYAAKRGHEPAVALLLAAKASVLRGAHGCSPLELACGVVGNLGVVERLLAAGSAVDPDKDRGPWTPYMQRSTPLRNAAYSGDDKIVARLLRARARVDAQSTNRSTKGWTALDIAADRMTKSAKDVLAHAQLCRRIVDVLLRAKASVHEHTAAGRRTAELLAEHYGTGFVTRHAIARSATLAP